MALRMRAADGRSARRIRSHTRVRDGVKLVLASGKLPELVLQARDERIQLLDYRAVRLRLRQVSSARGSDGLGHHGFGR